MNHRRTIEQIYSKGKENLCSLWDKLNPSGREKKSITVPDSLLTYTLESGMNALDRVYAAYQELKLNSPRL